MKDLVVAIDGPAGAGKTTVSKIVANKLGIDYCDSGSCYRAICYLALSCGIDPFSSNLLSLLSEKELILDSGKVFVDSQDLTPHLREPDVSANVSIVAANPEVRRYVTNLLISQKRKKGLVIEGRDIGTAIFPETPFKFYLDAHISIRKERRQGEAIEERDKIDSERKTAPLIRPDDALLIDTENLSSHEVADRILERVRFILRKNRFYWVAQRIVASFFKIFFRYSVLGAENIPKQGSLIVASNHMSFLDPPVIGVAMELHYFAKEELFLLPVFGWLIKNLNAFPVQREGFSRKAIEQTIRILENSGRVLIFPEGTRGVGLREPKRGIGLIARLANKKIRTPILPLRISGTEKALARGAWIIKPHKIKVAIGRPIQPETFFKKNDQEIANMVMEEIAKL
ncbi:MAG: (d)CMP kinase [bacterium]|nr:(d)CMP kinase [bacterium]